MAEFKVGDRVRVQKHATPHSRRGHEGTIIEKNNLYKVKFDDDAQGLFFGSELRVVESATEPLFAEGDKFKVGDRVVIERKEPTRSLGRKYRDDLVPNIGDIGTVVGTIEHPNVGFYAHDDCDISVILDKDPLHQACMAPSSRFELVDDKPPIMRDAKFQIDQIVCYTEQPDRPYRVVSIKQRGNEACTYNCRALGMPQNINLSPFAEAELQLFATISTPTSAQLAATSSENIMLNPVKVESRTVVTLPGAPSTDAKNLNDDELVQAIQQAEAEIEKLGKINANSKAIKARIQALQNGIDALVELLDSRQEEPAKKTKAK